MWTKVEPKGIVEVRKHKLTVIGENVADKLIRLRCCECQWIFTCQLVSKIIFDTLAHYTIEPSKINFDCPSHADECKDKDLVFVRPLRSGDNA